MKKLILAVAVLIAYGSANAQDSTIPSTGGKGYTNGDVFLSGTVSLSSTKTGDNENTTFNLTPKLGFFVTDNIAIGPQIGYVNTTTTEETMLATTEIKTTALQLGAFARLYGMPASDFSFFVEVGANYSSATTKEDNSDDFKVNGFNIRLAPGINYFIAEHFAIEASIGALSYETSKPDIDGAENTSTFGLNLNSTNINFGLVYKF